MYRFYFCNKRVNTFSVFNIPVFFQRALQIVWSIIGAIFIHYSSNVAKMFVTTMMIVRRSATMTITLDAFRFHVVRRWLVRPIQAWKYLSWVHVFGCCSDRLDFPFFLQCTARVSWAFVCCNVSGRTILCQDFSQIPSFFSDSLALSLNRFADLQWMFFQMIRLTDHCTEAVLRFDHLAYDRRGPPNELKIAARL